MKLMKKLIAVSSVMTGSLLLMFAVGNLELQSYCPDLPLISFNKLFIAGIIAYIPFFVWVFRRG